MSKNNYLNSHQILWECRKYLPYYEIKEMG